MAASRSVTAAICGGLGNQLFQAANLVAVARRSGAAMFLVREGSSSSIDEPRPTYWGTALRGLTTAMCPNAAPAAPLVVVPETRPVAPISLPAQAGAYNLVGFFQSEQFFADARDEVLAMLSDPAMLSAAAEHLRAYNPLDSEDPVYVAMHVRRGDYVKYADTFENLSHEYYDAALRQLLGPLLRVEERRAFRRTSDAEERPLRMDERRRRSRLKVLVFSDDCLYASILAGTIMARYPGVDAMAVSEAAEAARGITSPTEVTFADGSSQTLPREVLELYMMSLCHDVVIANSSFSWWGAYLNAVPLARVVAPSRWFTGKPMSEYAHIYADRWLVVMQSLLADIAALHRGFHVYKSHGDCCAVLRRVQALRPHWFTRECDAFVDSVAAIAPSPKTLPHPVILLDGLDGVGKTTVTQQLAQRIGARLICTPPPQFEATGVRHLFRSQPEPIARAFYCGANYLAAEEVQAAAGSQPVVMDRWWSSTCAMALAALEGGLPPPGDAVFQWPTDLQRPTRAFLLDVDEAIRRERALRRGDMKGEEIALAAKKAFRDAAMEAYRRTGVFTAISEPTWPLAVNAVATSLVADGILPPHAVRFCSPEECAAVSPT